MIARTKLLRGAALAALALIALPAHAQVQPAGNSFPTALPVPHTLPDPADTPYPGTIALDIDATDLATGTYRVTETVPVAPDATSLTLLLPEWIPGHHGHTGLPAELVGLHVFAGSRELTWHRDPVDTYAYIIDVPAGTRAVTARMIHTSPVRDTQSERITITPEMINLEWDRMTLYPAGHYVRDIRVRPSVTFPADFTVFTALDGHVASGQRHSWGETDYETLVDSPIFAGKHAKTFAIGDHVFLDVVADRADDLQITPEHLETYRALVREADAAFGARHFDHYDFLLGLTDRLGGVGLEHHRSNESTYLPKAWTDWTATDWSRNVVPHEYAHSWDGKYRRPAGLWTPDYRQPMIDDLLWVYEGQTQFWGLVLAARSGVQSKAMVLGELASYAGGFSVTAGREWRSVADTTYDPVFAARRPKPFGSLSRGEDYYTEGALVWLEADQIIRDGTAGHKSIDDFAHAFYGMRNGDWGVLTYTRADVVATLNAIYPHDWDAFFRTRIETPGQPVPVGGFERGGYHLVWKAEPNPYDAGRMAHDKSLNLGYSLGLVLDRDGKVSGALWDSPATRAGIVAGMQIVAVDGEAYDADGLKAAIRKAGPGGSNPDKPITLLVRRDNRYDTVAIAWHQGLRYPWLERDAAAKGETGLDRLLAPHHANTR